MKKIFLNKNKYKKIIFILSVIVAIFTINVFTFPASTLGNKCAIYGCVDTIDTSDIIEINLYDYGDNINNKYNSNNKYPGFQQSFGVNKHELNHIFAFHLGDVLVDNFEAGSAGAHEGTLNTNVGYTPARGFIHSTLVNGYPALKVEEGEEPISLKYLFSNEVDDEEQDKTIYAIKQNSNNLSHLFQYDENKEEYFYSSSNNHAEFTTENGIDRFRVYNAKITSNHYIFPFGNFFPLNKIGEQTTKTTEMGRDKFNAMAQSVSAWSSLPDTPEGRLYNGLRKLLNEMGREKLEVMLQELSAWKSLPDTAEGKLYNAIKITLDEDTDKNTDYISDVKKGIKYALRIHPSLEIGNDSITKLTSDEHLSNLYTIDYDKSTNFFYGFDMKFNFMQPKGGNVGNENMVFRFEGDDDVWVYIDGVLFLDLSGAHSQLGGEIDFKEGKVRYYDFDKTTYDVSKNLSGEPVKFEDIPGIDKSKLNDDGTFKDYSTHSLNFYYMERGAGASVMTTRFNMPLIKDHAITIDKKIDDSDKNAIGNKEYYFQIVAPDGSSLKGNNFSYDVYDEDNVKKSLETNNGIITLKANERAVISGIKENAGKYYVRELLDSEYEKVLVDGVNKLSSTNPKITIDEKEYTIVSSDEKDMSNGSSVITFTNDIKTSSLKIKKTLKDITNERAKNAKYRFYVTINGVPLKVGTEYKTDSRVEELGIIELKPGEEAIIDKIIPGSKFKVEERLLPTSGLTDSYLLNGVDTNAKYASGEIKLFEENKVEVINEEKSGTKIEIPIKKMTTNPDGVNHTYTFTLVGVGNNESKSIDVNTDAQTGTSEGVFKLEYSQLEHPDSETIYNYQIKEIVDNDKYTLYDDSIYDIKVKVINVDSKFEVTYTVSKNGEKVDNIVFNNQRLSSLTIKKTVESDNPNDGRKFNFSIELNELIEGLYEYETLKGDVSDVITFDTNKKATVTLSHNESITIYGLPYGSKYTITETNPDGYSVMYKVNSSGYIEGSKITDKTLIKDTIVEFKNVKGYELPKTGSSGMLVITSIGIIFTSISFVYLLKKKIGVN